MTGQSQLLDNLATISRDAGPAVASQYDIQPVVDIYAGKQDRDLAGVSGDFAASSRNFRASFLAEPRLTMRGQVETMISSFTGLAIGLIFSIILVYLLMVVNFQSWVDPFIIITALPGALAGIAWMLFLTGTTLSVPSLMGAIMCIGVATSNSILLVTFAASQMQRGKEFRGGRRERGVHAAAAGDDDRAGHDRWHDPHVPGNWRGRGTECSSGPRGDRRLAGRHGGDAVLCSRRVQRSPPQGLRRSVRGVKSPGRFELF